VTSQPPLPTHSNLPLLAGALIVLGGAAGLWWWRSSTPPPKVAAAPASVTSAAGASEPPLPVMEELAPPPPPSEPAPSASSEPRALTGARPAARATATAADPCGGDCGGSVPQRLQSELGAVGRTARRCYDEALKRDPALAGRVVVSVRVGGGGRVCSAGIEENGTGDAPLGACVAQKFGSARLSAPQGGCVDVRVPLNFVPPNAR
jgi:hypothetical protein